MREIKFRAWDKKRKEMCDWSKVRQWTLDQIYQPEAYEEEIEMLQYTGLKDKNGKEIYEGDILVITKARCWDMQVFKWKGQIHWNHNGVHIGTHKIRKKQPQDYEIIGNIYENPELLK